jgi:hypothetical protein
MSELLDRITAHFDSLGQRQLVVPEWETTIYFTPVTIADRNRIYKGSKGENDYETMVNIIIVKALDQDGKHHFTSADKPKLLQHADSALIARVAAAIMNGDAPNAEELKTA